MLSFFKGLYQIFRCFREFVISLFFILFVLILLSLISLFKGETNNLKNTAPIEEGALLLNLDGYLADNHDELNEFRVLLKSELGGNEQLKVSTFDVVRVINHAENNPKIKGIVLDLSDFKGGDLPSLTFIGEQLNHFKQSGKPVIAIGESYSQAQYYLASFANKIYLNKAGFVSLHGISYTNLYFKALFDKIEAVPHIFRVGTYKSAVEPFLRNDMSPEARQNAEQWANKMWQRFSLEIAMNRKISASAVLPPAEQYLSLYRQAKGDDAVYALKQGLVDQLISTAEAEQILVKNFGKDEEKHYRYTEFNDYLNTLSDRFDRQDKHKIAVINVEGQIVWGESDEQSAGSTTITKLLRKAKEEESIKGVILRINSPGGSAMASELIRQEIESVQKAGKPVVASMGGMAASGGYWIATTSDKIIASPTTLTGSIGIFGLAVTFEKTAQKIGIQQDGIATSPLADQGALKTLPALQADLIQISIDNGYDRFIELVSQGRKMSKQAVDKIAQGQVWIGENAVQNGLVDQLGDFHTAYDQLVKLINQHRAEKGENNIDGFALQWLIDREHDLISRFIRDFKMEFQGQFIKWFKFPMAQQIQEQLGILNNFNDPKQRYLYCLNCSTIK